MHPVEHLFYFATIFYHLIIPFNPIIALYQLHFAGFGAIPGHVGFEKVEITENTAIGSHAYIHCLHHKYFEVNYDDGLIPLDRWFGMFHDGSKESDEGMKARFGAKKARVAAKRGMQSERMGSNLRSGRHRERGCRAFRSRRCEFCGVQGQR